ncbi:MAG: hypothetical protein AAF581_09765 [Planctomycetota bacterium]
MQLPRLHLVEFEDLSICPAIVRDYGTDYLQFVQSRFALYLPMVDMAAATLERNNETQLVDLCSGGGGPMLDVVRELRAKNIAATATLTDRFPNHDVAAACAANPESRCLYHLDPVDARAVPPTLAGVRTICNALHHFRPQDVKQILRSAVAARQPFIAFEISERTVRVVLSTFFAPVMLMLTTPWIRPFRWRRLLLTYIVPLVPLLCLWDGVVSQLRSYTPAELEAMAREVDAAGYEWAAGKVGNDKLPTNVTYLTGSPLEVDAHSVTTATNKLT